MSIPPVVIIGDHTQGLGILRSAAVKGGELWVVNDKSISLARFSKYLSHYEQIHRGLLARLSQPPCSERLLNRLLDLPLNYPALLFGVNEDISRFIYHNAETLKQKYFVPSVRLDTIYDKYLFNLLLPERVRIDTRLCSEQDLASLDCPEHYIVKGRQGNAFRQLTGEKAITVNRFTQHHAGHVFERIPADQIIIQQLISTERPVLSVCSFSVGGSMVGMFAYEKLRQHPNEFGTGTYLRSVHPGALHSLAEQVLTTLQYTGISEIEFIHDSQTGGYKIIEMNPRPWKSIHFASQCGANLIEKYISHVANGTTDYESTYACGQYWVDLATDIPQLARELKWPCYRHGLFECTWDWNDPLPALALWTLFPLIAVEDAIASFGQVT
ncbi:MAG: hypothetical protein IPP12_17045 [Nitrospira sp.]|nr:hypothetical protein [Nitrospira sp.]